MEQKSQFDKLINSLVSQGCFSSRPFTVVDVGCSGGISQSWRSFEPSLKAVGVDPVIAECSRLEALEKNPKVKYLPAYVGLPAEHSHIQIRGDRSSQARNPWHRLSAQAASDILKLRNPDKIFAKSRGGVKLENLETGESREGGNSMVKRDGAVILVDDREQEIEKHVIPTGFVLEVKEGQKV